MSRKLRKGGYPEDAEWRAKFFTISSYINACSRAILGVSERVPPFSGWAKVSHWPTLAHPEDTPPNLLQEAKMTKYNNWPNLRLTYVVNTGETDYWGLPVVTTVSYDQVCKRGLVSLQNAQRLCAICAADAFPDAVSIECVDVQWLGRPVVSRYEDELVSNRQLDFPF